MSKHTITELHQLQGLSLNEKIERTKARIRQWVEHYGVDGCYVSFSGGKDSLVLLHLARSLYPDIKAVFLDTSLEFPELREFVKTFDNVEFLKPKMNFRQVIEKYGYPVISKEVTECVYGARIYLTTLLNEETISSQSVSQSVSHSSRMHSSSERCAESENTKRRKSGGGYYIRLPC